MGTHIKIPVLKNQGVILNKQRQKKKRGLIQFSFIISLFVLMLTFVWLKVETNLTLATLQKLEEKLHESRIQNEKLKAEVIRLSNFSRIQKIARVKLGLDFVNDENIVEIQKN